MFRSFLGACVALAGCNIARPAYRENYDRAAVPGRIEERKRWCVGNCRDSTELIRSAPRKVSQSAQGFECALGWMDDKPRKYFAQWVQLKLEAGHDTEAAGSVPQPPVQLRMILRRRTHESLIG